MQGAGANLKQQFDGNSSSRFIELAYELVALAEKAGCSIVPFYQSHIPYFNSQTDEKKRSILEAPQVFIDICHLTLTNGKKLDDTKALTWYGLKHLNLRFTSDLLERISDGDILEVYTNDNIQIFRNFKFFELTSYSIEDIFCRPWTDLFIRHDIDKAAKTLEVMKKMSTREIVNTISLEFIGAHKIEEALSPFRYQYDYTIKYLSPVYDKERHPVGYVMIESATILNPIKSHIEQELLLKNFQYANSQPREL